MKTLDYTKLDSSKVEGVIEGLKQLLSDYHIYYANLRGFHWNIKGKGFFVLHSKFEEMYDNASEKIDEIAERILMLGSTPDNQLSKHIENATIKEVANVVCGDEALKNVLETLSSLIAAERKVLASASEADDEATSAMMSDYIREQEKTVWMLVAHMS